MNLWGKEEERKFFEKALRLVTPEHLFYITEDGRYLAYWPKGYRGKKSTLQSRNSLIGSYTEKWVCELLEDVAKEHKAYAVHNVISESIGLGRQSPADVAIVKRKGNVQRPEDILLIVEVKMSVVWNWEYIPENREIKPVGDYTTHQGNPSLLRSDSMLKAIVKSINIRVSGVKSAKIPIIVVGNTPISKSYFKKVDNLKKYGIVQGFFSLNPNPVYSEDNGNIKSTKEKGFLRIDSLDELKNELNKIIGNKREFFSAMMNKKELGRIIDIACLEHSYEKKAEKFLSLMRGEENE